MQDAHPLLTYIGLLVAAWAVAASWTMIAVRRRLGQARAALRQGRRLARMIDDAPVQPMLVRADGRLEAPFLLAKWLGMDKIPERLCDLDALANGGRGGLLPAHAALLMEAVHRAQTTGAPFHLIAPLMDSPRSLAFHGHLADPRVFPGGAALVWVFDTSDAVMEITRLREDVDKSQRDFAALVGLIEAAPLPMWFRGPDGTLRLVNSAYVRAVGGRDAVEVVASGTELIETVDGRTPADIALAAAKNGRPVERVLQATIVNFGDSSSRPFGGGVRRTLRVSDLPLGERGVAGYAVDIEDMEEVARAFRAFREAQRSMLDLLSSGVAQFDADGRLRFVNQPFVRLLRLSSDLVRERPSLEQVLDLARDAGRVPETRDYPAWRSEHVALFSANHVRDEAWPLADGTHLRLLAQPMPDGGLLVILEDRTETLRISAMRDTLLRTRTATFDSLSEAVAVFAPDGRLQLWNQRFVSMWELTNAYADGHPRIDHLLEHISLSLVHADDKIDVSDVVSAATLERRPSEARITLADGRTLLCSGVPLPDGNGLLTVLDITDSQKAQDALRERNATLMEADAIKTRFLANMSYEFRTPLTSITGFAELLQAGHGGDLSETARQYIDAILESSAQLGEQIENVLELSQSEAGLLPLNTEDLELFPFVSELVGERAAVLRENGLTLDLRGDHRAGRITADKRRLARALGHLLDNAIAASPPQGRISITLSRLPASAGRRARILITDSGAGMSEDEMVGALEGVKLARSGEAENRQRGLGLPLARQLIEAHGGTLELTSSPGRGTRVTVELP